MKKITILLILTIALVGSAIAQKPVVYIAPFKYSGKDIRKLLPEFRSAVMSGVDRSHRVDIIDRSESTQILEPDEMLEDARKAKADMILQCELLNHNLTDILNLVQAISDAANNKSNTIYDKLAYNVKLTRVSDGLLLGSQKFENSGSAYYSSTTTTTTSPITSATSNALSWISRQMRIYFESRFPLEARIVEVAEVNKDRVTKVYIDLGNRVSIAEGQDFEVYEKKIVAGEQTQDLLGRVCVISVKSENRSLCRVSRNAKGLKKALDEGAELVLISLAN